MIDQKWLRAAICLVLAVLVLGAPQPSRAQQSAQLVIYPAVSEVQVGETFQVWMNVVDVVDLYAFELNVTFPPQLVQAVSVENGGFLTPWMELPFIYNDIGLVRLDVTQINPTPPQSGSGSLMLITFQAQAMLGTGAVRIGESILADMDGIPMDYSVVNGGVRVCEGSVCQRVFLPLVVK